MRTRISQVIEKDLEEADPALELPYKTCVKIAKALGATIPTWQQWEAAVRGPQAWLYPWGNDFDHVRMEIEVPAPPPSCGSALSPSLRPEQLAQALWHRHTPTVHYQGIPFGNARGPCAASPLPPPGSDHARTRGAGPRDCSALEVRVLHTPVRRCKPDAMKCRSGAAVDGGVDGRVQRHRPVTAGRLEGRHLCNRRGSYLVRAARSHGAALTESA